jgi:MFS family permease
MFFRVVAAVGIGGEWAAGASMVAETVPENRRVEAGALLYTAGPLGLLLATFANSQIAGVYLAGSPEVSWRYVFACGLIPAVIAFLVRLFVREPERWQDAASQAGAQAAPTIAELFGPKYLRATQGGLALALAALLSWWSSNAFLPVVTGGLAAAQAESLGLSKSAAQAFTEGFKAHASLIFNVGGVLGTLAVIPAAKYLSRRALFALFLVLIMASMLPAFGLRWDLQARAWLYGPIGFATYGIFSALTFYLPELYPTRLRATGAGFTYNVGRFVTALGPFLVGSIAARGADASQSALQVLFAVGFVPLIGLVALPLVTETKGRALLD